MVKLVDDWKKVHTWLSVQFAAALTAITVAYDNLAILQQALEVSLLHKIQAALGIGVVLGRIVKQNKDVDKPAA